MLLQLTLVQGAPCNVRTVCPGQLMCMRCCTVAHTPASIVHESDYMLEELFCSIWAADAASRKFRRMLH